MKKYYLLGWICIVVMSTTNALAIPKEVTKIVTVTPPPTGAAAQAFCAGATLNDIIVTGSNIKWYATSNTASLFPINSLLANGYTYYASQTIGGIESITRLAITITINPLPLAIPPSPLHYCDPNNDGMGVFDLASTATQIVGGNILANIVITYHNTIVDAMIGVAALPSPYYNINPWNETVYVRVHNTNTGCISTTQLQLIVDPTPQPTIPSEYHICDYTGVLGQEAFDLTTKKTEILGSINPAQATVTFYTDAAGSVLIANPSSYLNTATTQIVYARVTMNATGCYNTVPLTLVVDPLPQALQPNYPQYALCDTPAYGIGTEAFNLQSQIPAILLGQSTMVVTFYPSLAAAQNNTNLITNVTSYVNVPIYVQTLGIRITNLVTGCYVISTMDIRVIPLPTPIPPTAPYAICDDNQDGIAEFDLNTLTAELNQGANYTIDYYENLTDTTIGNNAIPNPGHYLNINPFYQTIYARATDVISGCSSVLPIELVVNPAPIQPNLPDIVVCDTDGNTQNGFTLVDLTVNTAPALALQTLASTNYTVLYFTSYTLALSGIAPIINPTSYSAYNGQVIWALIENNISGCYQLASFQITINMPLQLVTPLPLALCDDDANPNDQYHVFDLTVRDTMITQGLAGYTVTYYPSYPIQVNDVPISNPTGYSNIHAGVQTVGAKVTSNQGCSSYTTLDIRVLPIPIVNTPPAIQVCDVNNPGDMVETVDLSVNAAYILNGNPFYSLQYYPSYNDAVEDTNVILNSAAAEVSGDVWIRVKSVAYTDYLGNNCFVIVKQAINILSQPASPVITQTGTTLYSSITNATIQWYNQEGIIADAIGSSYTPVYNDTYYAVYNPTGYCGSLPSNTITMSNLGITSHTQTTVFTLYPNPATDSFTLVDDNFAEGSKYSITDVVGKTILTGSLTGTSTTIDSSMIAKGVYWVTLHYEGRNQTLRLLKQ